jgi:hypothetical protein
MFTPIGGGGGGGSDTFLQLLDTPANYSGQALRLVRVNSGSTGLEFAAFQENSILTISSSGGVVELPNVTAIEVGFLQGLTSNAQNQINGKANIAHTQNINTITGASNKILAMDSSGNGRTLNDWTVQNVYGAEGLSQFLTTAPEDDTNTQFLRVNFYELEINTVNNTEDTFVTNWALDTHIDRTGSNGDFDGGVTNVQYRLTAEGEGDLGDIIGVNSTVQAGVGSNSGSCNFVTGMFHQAVTGNNYNASGITALNLSTQVGQNSVITNNVNGMSISVDTFSGSSMANLEALSINLNLGTNTTTVNNFTSGIRIGGSGTIDTEISLLEVNAQNFTSNNSNVSAARFFGNVSIVGDLNFTGGLSVGKLDAFGFELPVDQGGLPSNVHSLISATGGEENTTTANADIIGVNTACLIQMQENAVNTSGPFQLGIAALALPAVVDTKTGSNLEHLNAAVFALNFDVGSTGGTVQNAHGCRAVFIPNGVTTVTNSRGFLFDAPFGNISSNAWGVYINADVENWFKESVKIGSGDKVENSSVGLQVDGRAVLLPRLTTTERNALTALNGMVIYNTTDDKFQGYEDGSWQNLI